jgi:hypothetical protein
MFGADESPKHSQNERDNAADDEKNDRLHGGGNWLQPWQQE